MLHEEDSVAAFIAGALAASAGTAAALTEGHVFRLQEGDHATYGTIDCRTQYVLQYITVQCFWRTPLSDHLRA